MQASPATPYTKKLYIAAPLIAYSGSLNLSDALRLN